MSACVFECCLHGCSVAGPPGPPTSIHVEEITDTTATLSWRPGPDNHSPITAYTIQARTPFSLGWQAVSTGGASNQPALIKTFPP